MYLNQKVFNLENTFQAKELTNITEKFLLKFSRLASSGDSMKKSKYGKRDNTYKLK
jgi:hypothetical protein